MVKGEHRTRARTLVHTTGRAPPLGSGAPGVGGRRGEALSGALGSRAASTASGLRERDTAAVARSRRELSRPSPACSGALAQSLYNCTQYGVLLLWCLFLPPERRSPPHAAIEPPYAIEPECADPLSAQPLTTQEPPLLRYLATCPSEVIRQHPGDARARDVRRAGGGSELTSRVHARAMPARVCRRTAVFAVVSVFVSFASSYRSLCM